MYQNKKEIVIERDNDLFSRTLNYNKLTSLPKNLFDNMSNLRTL